VSLADLIILSHHPLKLGEASGLKSNIQYFDHLPSISTAQESHVR
jgi:hypothetical protein